MPIIKPISDLRDYPDVLRNVELECFEKGESVVSDILAAAMT